MSKIDWRRIEPTTIKKVGWRTIVTKNFAMPDGSVAAFDTMHAEDFQSAAVIAITTNNQVVIARQFRASTERLMWEIPGGMVDGGEQPEDAARRELLEETGYRAGTMTALGEFGRDSYMNGRWHFYLATDCVLSTDQLELDNHEFISVELITIQQLIDNAKTNQMSDPVAVLAAYDLLQARQAL